MADLWEAFSSIAPIDFSAVPLDRLSSFLTDTFAQAELLINSVPRPPPPSEKSPCEPPPALPNVAKRAADTASSVCPPPTRADNDEHHKAWGKPLKIKDNPLNVAVYKMAAHDRHGAWFARRGVHQGIGFSKFKSSMRREFMESLAVTDGPGSGAKRGLSGDERLERKSIKGVGNLEVWQLSAQFGPVTPREFCTLLLSSDNALSEASTWEDDDGDSDGPPRHLMLVSRPTTHPDLAARKQLVRGTYESVELIRELPASCVKTGDSQSANGQNGDVAAETKPVEWVMITRSDPGGTIPKFMVERGTPDSIVSDVTKFLDWACQRDDTDDDSEAEEDAEVAGTDTEDFAAGTSTAASAGAVEAKESSRAAGESSQEATQDTKQSITDPSASEVPAEHSFSAAETAAVPEGYLSQFRKTVGTTVSGYLPFFQPQEGVLYKEGDGDSSSSDSLSSSDTSTIRTYDTANDMPLTTGADSAATEQPQPASDAASVGSSRSSTQLPHEAPTPELAAADSGKPTRTQEKELAKLASKRAALDARIAKANEAEEARAQEISHKDEKEQARAREKHDKERARQRERFERDAAKLEERRLKEVARLEERRKKARDKDVLARAQREREEWRERCLVAERESELLRGQVERLQKENTMLVARMSVEDLDRARVRASSRGSARSAKSHESKESKESKDGKESRGGGKDAEKT